MTNMALKRPMKAQPPSTSQTQGEQPEPQIKPEFDNDDNEDLEGNDVTQLWEEIHMLTRDQKND